MILTGWYLSFSLSHLYSFSLSFSYTFSLVSYKQVFYYTYSCPPCLSLSLLHCYTTPNLIHITNSLYLPPYLPTLHIRTIFFSLSLSFAFCLKTLPNGGNNQKLKTGHFIKWISPLARLFHHLFMDACALVALCTFVEMFALTFDCWKTGSTSICGIGSEVKPHPIEDKHLSLNTIQSLFDKKWHLNKSWARLFTTEIPKLFSFIHRFLPGSESLIHNIFGGCKILRIQIYRVRESVWTVLLKQINQ